MLGLHGRKPLRCLYTFTGSTVMAWSWSHSGEAYANAEANLHALPHADLAVIYAEWRAAQRKGTLDDNERFSLRKYERALPYAQHQAASTLAEQIWEWASEAATCSNGGFEAYMCPSGCHTVPFDLQPGVHSRSCEVNGDQSGCETCQKAGAL